MQFQLINILTGTRETRHSIIQLEDDGQNHWCNSKKWMPKGWRPGDPIINRHCYGTPVGKVWIVFKEKVAFLVTIAHHADFR